MSATFKTASPARFPLFGPLSADRLANCLTIRRIIPELLKCFPDTPYTFIRPDSINGSLQEFHPKRGVSKACVQSIAMTPRSVIPFAVHQHTSNLLVFPAGCGDFTYYAWAGRRRIRRDIAALHTSPATIVVPPKTFYALVCHTCRDAPLAHVFVHATDADADDIEWEPDAERLWDTLNHLALASSATVRLPFSKQ